MRSLPIGFSASLLAATVAGSLGCRPSTSAGLPSASDREAIERRVSNYFRKVADLPDDVSLRLVDIEPSAVANLLHAELEIGNNASSRRVPLVLTRDGRFVVQGTLVDLMTDPYEVAMAQIDLAGRALRGNPDGAVTIVAYVDFQCPFSARAYKTLVERILPTNDDEVRIALKHFPLATVHPWAESAALAAACAEEQGAPLFWSLAGFLFREQESLEVAAIADRCRDRIAADGGDESRFARCYDEGSAQSRVVADVAEGRKLGVRSTPTFFVNGRKLEGARPFEELTVAVAAARGAAATQPGRTTRNMDQRAQPEVP